MFKHRGQWSMWLCMLISIKQQKCPQNGINTISYLKTNSTTWRTLLSLHSILSQGLQQSFTSYLPLLNAFFHWDIYFNIKSIKVDIYYSTLYYCRWTINNLITCDTNSNYVNAYNLEQYQWHKIYLLFICKSL